MTQPPVEPDSAVASLPEGEGRDLAIAFKRGDKGAYQAIYDRYADRVNAVCGRMLHEKEEAREAAQDTFLRAWQALPRFNGRYQLGAWMARIATNVCLDRLRAQQRHPCDTLPGEVFDQELADPLQSDPETFVLRRAEGRRIRKVLQQLPPLHRAAIVLRDFEGLTYEEVAQTLEITEPQVKALLHRARKGFKRDWSGLATILLPGRLLDRVKTVNVSAREQAAQAVAPAVQGSAACTSALQQCGQYVADKFAPLFAASVIGVAGIAGPAALAPQRMPSEPKATTAASNGPVLANRSGSMAPKATVAVTKSTKKKVGSNESPSTKKSAASSPSAAPTSASSGSDSTPAAGPSPSPSPQPSSSPGGGSDKKGDRGPGEETIITPTPPLLAFNQGQTMQTVEPTSSNTTVDCATWSVDQVLETVVGTKDGDIPGTLRLDSGSSAGFQLEVRKDGWDIRYSAGGTLIDKSVSARYARLHYVGSYSTGSSYANAAGLPMSGSFDLYLALDCESSTLVTQRLVLSN